MPIVQIAIMTLCLLVVSVPEGRSQNSGGLSPSPEFIEQMMLNALDGALGNSSHSFEFVCYRCGAAGRGFNAPTTQGCTNRGGHHWGKVGDSGQKRWTCKKCRAQVNTARKPDSSSCAGKGYHIWLDY